MASLISQREVKLELRAPLSFLTPSRAFGRQGLSIPEIIFVLAVVGILLGGAWHWAMSAYGDLKINSTVQLVHEVALAGHSLKMTPSEVSRDDLKGLVISIPPDLVELNTTKNNAGELGLFNVWGGKIWAFPGHAAFWGTLEGEKEITVVVEDVPSATCPAFVEAVMNIPDIKPVVLFFAQGVGLGEEICMTVDSYCKTAVPFDIRSVKKACSSKGDKILLAFTYLR